MSLFIAVVIMSILLFISFVVINISAKSNIFATSGRDSQYAFYAADAGLECAIYWDSKYNSFSTSTASSIVCANQSISTNTVIAGTSTLALVGGGGNTNPSVFGFVLNTGSNPVSHCAIVTVRKYYSGSNLMTYIKSRGYNTCDTNNPRRLERGVEVTY